MTLKPHRKRHGFEVSTRNLSNCLRHEDLVLRPLHFVCWIWGTSKESKRKLIKIYGPATHGKIIDNLLFEFNTVQHPILIVCCFPESSFIWQKIYISRPPVFLLRPEVACLLLSFRWTVSTHHITCLCPFWSFPSILMQAWHRPESCSTRH